MKEIIIFLDDNERLADSSLYVMSASKLFQKAGPDTGNAFALTVEHTNWFDEKMVR